jgi:acetoin utilization protein AcuC
VNADRTVFLYNESIEGFPYPPENPFKVERARMTRETARSMGLLGSARETEAAPPPARRAELEAFHDSAYLDLLSAAQTGRMDLEVLRCGLGTPDCPVFRGLYDYSALACGASLHGARLLANGDARAVFNPAGGLHHAGPHYAAGFCYMNDIVLADLWLADNGKRVFSIDLDVHHGDGVQNAFYERNDVFTFSMHESGRTLFPGTGFENEIGRGAGKGYCVNIPLPVGAYDAAYETAFMEVAMPLLKAFDPDVVVMELGMDGLAGDPLAHLHLTNNVLANLVRRVRDCDKPVLATGGGGYNVPNTVRGWALIWSVLCRLDHDDPTAGLGGVMMENTDWLGGLRDRTLLSDAGDRGEVDRQIAQTVKTVKNKVFHLHGL